jgi:hypothetical protein
MELTDWLLVEVARLLIESPLRLRALSWQSKRGSKLIFVKRDVGQTNEQQRHFKRVANQ